MQSYLVERETLLGLVDQLELDYKSRERARFVLSRFTDAAAPTNTLLGNPRALAEAVQTRGQSLISGLRHFLHDLRHNGAMPALGRHPSLHRRGQPGGNPGSGGPP